MRDEELVSDVDEPDRTTISGLLVQHGQQTVQILGQPLRQHLGLPLALVLEDDHGEIGSLSCAHAAEHLRVKALRSRPQRLTLP